MRKMKRTKTIPGLVAAILLAVPAAALALPRAEAVPGGIAVIPVGETDDPAPYVEYRGRRAAVVPENGHWHALVGIGLSAKPGSHQLTVKRGARNQTVRFQVNDKEYETQHITIKNKRKVNPYKNDLKRIRSEQKRSRAAFATWTDRDHIPTPFALPVNGIVSGTFGKRRYFNGQARRPHSGLDIAAPKGTPIRAPAPGRVVETGHYFFNGKVVFIDHGQGVVTMFCHMNSIDAEIGDTVQAGDIVGTVGATGRVTGPHLHWSVSVANTRVDPTLFLPNETLASLKGL